MALSQSNVNKRRRSLVEVPEETIRRAKSPFVANTDKENSINIRQTLRTPTFDEILCTSQSQLSQYNSYSDSSLPSILSSSLVTSKKSSVARVFQKVVPILPVPVTVNDRCCVRYDGNRGFFGTDEGSIWYGGTVIDVKAMKSADETTIEWKMQIRHDDNQISSIVWPKDSSMLSKLQRKGQHRGFDNVDFEIYDRVIYDDQGDDTGYEFFCDCRPKNLNLGDRVLTYYQNGVKNSAWHTGRIAAVKNLRDSNDTYCDVAYDDGNYERYIPLSSSVPVNSNEPDFSGMLQHRTRYNIVAFERGMDNSKWMKGLKVNLNSDKWKSVKSGEITRITPIDRKVEIEYVLGNAKEYESKPYEVVVGELFATAYSQLQENDKQCKNLIEKKIKIWPGSEKLVEAMEGDDVGILGKRRILRGTSSAYAKVIKSCGTLQINKQSMTKSSSIIATNTCMKRSKSTINVNKQSTTKSSSVSTSTSCNKQSKSTSEAPNPSRNRNSNGQSTKTLDATTKKRHLQRNQLNNKTSSLSPTSVVATDSADDTAFCSQHDVLINKRPYYKLNSSLGCVLTQAVNSSETQAGMQMLTMMNTCHNLIPNYEVNVKLMKLIMYGPKSGETLYPDCYKMEESLRQIQFQMAPSLPTSTATKDELITILGINSTNTFIAQMQSCYYMVDGDEYRTTPQALNRVGQSIHAKFCFATIYCTLIEHAVKPFLSKGFTYQINKVFLCDDKKTNLILCTDNKLVQSISKYPARGSQDVLDKLVTITATFWFEFRHYLSPNENVDAIVNKDDAHSSEATMFVVAQLTRILASMGRTICYIARLYTNEVSGNADSLADLIKNIIVRVWDELEEKVKLAKGEKQCNTDGVSARNKNCGKSRVKVLSKSCCDILQLKFILQLDEKICPRLQQKLAERFQIVNVYNKLKGKVP
jgi:hypothetical protein